MTEQAAAIDAATETAVMIDSEGNTSNVAVSSEDDVYGSAYDRLMADRGEDEQQRRVFCAWMLTNPLLRAFY